MLGRLHRFALTAAPLALTLALTPSLAATPVAGGSPVADATPALPAAAQASLWRASPDGPTPLGAWTVEHVLGPTDGAELVHVAPAADGVALWIAGEPGAAWAVLAGTDAPRFALDAGTLPAAGFTAVRLRAPRTALAGARLFVLVPRPTASARDPVLPSYGSGVAPGPGRGIVAFQKVVPAGGNGCQAIVSYQGARVVQLNGERQWLITVTAAVTCPQGCLQLDGKDVEDWNGVPAVFPDLCGIRLKVTPVVGTWGLVKRPADIAVQVIQGKKA